MATQLVLSVIGPDRPGLVSSLADTVAEHGGNWLTSELAHLAGSFAGIVLVDLPADRVDALTDGVRRLDEQGLLDVRITPAAEERADPAALDTGRQLGLHLVGQDRPGIVREISGVLAHHGVSIVELSTDTHDAPQSGGTLFEATALVGLPDGVDQQRLQDALEALADELMVDVFIDPAD